MRNYQEEVIINLHELITKVELKIVQTPAKDFLNKAELEIVRDTLIRASDCVENLTETQFLHVVKKADFKRANPIKKVNEQLHLIADH